MFTRLFRSGVGDPFACICLQHHHAHAMGHDIVQLAADPGALLGQSGPGLLVSLLLSLNVVGPASLGVIT